MFTACSCRDTTFSCGLPAFQIQWFVDVIRLATKWVSELNLRENIRVTKLPVDFQICSTWDDSCVDTEIMGGSFGKDLGLKRIFRWVRFPVVSSEQLLLRSEIPRTLIFIVVHDLCVNFYSIV